MPHERRTRRSAYPAGSRAFATERRLARMQWRMAGGTESATRARSSRSPEVMPNVVTPVVADVTHPFRRHRLRDRAIPRPSRHTPNSANGHGLGDRRHTDAAGDWLVQDGHSDQARERRVHAASVYGLRASNWMGDGLSGIPVWRNLRQMVRGANAGGGTNHFGASELVQRPSGPPRMSRRTHDDPVSNDVGHAGTGRCLDGPITNH